MIDVMTSLAYLHQKPAATGRLKVKPTDFFVSETLNFTPAEVGEHVLIRLQKTGENTKYVANELAKACGVSSRDVSWAGLKDRHAVTQQWFSVHLPGKPSPDLSEFIASHEGVDAVLALTRHDKKLRPGDLIANHFKLVIRELSGHEQIETRLAAIRDKGVANYFGSQRFGHAGNNVIAARDWGQGKFQVRDKSKRSFYLSAARSYLFNRVLSSRIERGVCYQPMLGDLLINANHETQLVVDIAIAQSLLDEGDWQISGPMTGDNRLPTSGDALAFEEKIVADEPHLLALIKDNRMRHERRPLLLYPQNMQWTKDQDTLTVDFSLPAGCFATSVMREIIEETTEGGLNAYID